MPRERTPETPATPSPVPDAGSMSAPSPSETPPTPAPTDTPEPTPAPSPKPPPAIQDGSFAHPFWVEAFPATFNGDTRVSGTESVSTYACAPTTREDGPELVYAFESSEAGILTAVLDDVSGDTFDVDVHILDAPDPGACLARGNISVARAIAASKTYYVVVDTWFNGTTALEAPFTLSLGFTALADDGSCPSDMVSVPSPSGKVCMDRFEAPNLVGEQPFVMFTFPEADTWCQARGKRLCYDDEWTFACGGLENRTYVWGNDLGASTCNNRKTYRPYDQDEVGKWPAGVNGPSIANRAAQFAAAAMVSPTAAEGAAHIESLYQAEGSGAYPSCVDEWGVYDLTGSVEEWTRRRDGGEPGFHGSLKGRYWADTRTCQSNITSHADAFRFYEIGFRCCRDP